MSTAKFVGRVGALAIALGVGFTAATAPGAAIAATSDSSTVDSTALIVCSLACATPDAYFVDSMMNQFVTPTHSGQTLTPVGVTGPTDSFPILGILRLIVTLTGDPKAVLNLWPDEPWWKLTGFFDLTSDQSVAAGVTALEAAMAAHGNNHLVIAAESGGAAVAVAEKRKLAAQYPPGTTAPDISFVLAGDPSVPNGGLNSRFPGLPTFFLGTFTSAEPTDTQFHTDVIIRQYDGAADFPLYPLNIVADLNAVLGFFYVHTYPFDVGLPADPTTSPAYQGTHGDSSYYFFPTDELPLFAPLRQIGVPEGVIDVIEPVTRVIVEAGYDRSIPPWQPTTARLIPQLDPTKFTSDLINAVSQGVDNAVALVIDPSKLAPTIPPPIVAHVATLVSTLQTVASRQTPTTTVNPIKQTAGGLPSGPASTGISPQVTSGSTPTQVAPLAGLAPNPLAAPATAASTTPVSAASTKPVAASIVSTDTVAAATTASTEAQPAVSTNGGANIASAPNTVQSVSQKHAVSSVTTPVSTALTRGSKPVTAALSKPTTPAVSSVTSRVRTAISSVSTALTSGSKPVTAAVSKPTTRVAGTSASTVKSAAGQSEDPQ